VRFVFKKKSCSDSIAEIVTKSGTANPEKMDQLVLLEENPTV
jgi:hypothetical protein